MNSIVVTGAREHNLKGITVRIPRGKLVVFTGVSGSGKSSLAFDTLYAEGQRRYVESLSAYARQFLGQMERPHYETVRGLSPTIAISQRTSGNTNPRSTVATVTEILDYLRVLYARLGTPHCPRCDGMVKAQSAQQIVARIAKLGDAESVTLLAPLVESRKGAHEELLEDAQRQGFTRVVVDTKLSRLDELDPLDPKKKHTIDLVIDRVRCGSGELARLTDSVETALRVGSGLLKYRPKKTGKPILVSERLDCASCGVSFPELTPKLFSFNSPVGMCPACQGLGSKLEVDLEKVIPDPSLSIREGAITSWNRSEGWGTTELIAALEATEGIKLDLPWRRLSARHKNVVLEGCGDKELTVRWKTQRGSGEFKRKWEGITHQIQRRFRDTQSDDVRRSLLRFFSHAACEDCDGARLNELSRAVRVQEHNLPDLLSLRVEQALQFLEQLKLDGAQGLVAKEILREVRSRLSFLLDVGIGYLSLDRPAATLAGGEAQRIRLASQLGSELSGVLYVLDEPSIGLHPRDTARLVSTLLRLRDADNTVLVVEHEPSVIEAADHIVDFGPGAGELGGRVVAQGTPKKLRQAKASLTGRYLSGRERVEIPAQRRPGTGNSLGLLDAELHNLKNLDVSFPLGTLCVVTGVSGAGKSSLISGCLVPWLRKSLSQKKTGKTQNLGLTGAKHLDKLVVLDQGPIGLTPRSNPATYVKAFDGVRKLFASLPESKAYGFTASRFSFNVKGGRCELCQGAGRRNVEMHFLPDLHVVCEACNGKRFNEATLRVRFKGKSIAEVLELTISEAERLFEHHQDIARPLHTLVDVGLGYLAVGQASTTLSGGEAQRVKLSRELSRRSTGRTLYVLDEPTTGLHFHDVKQLLSVLNKLVDAKNTVIVIEHNLEVIKCADFVVDMGPEGGEAGGEIVATGTPEQLSKLPKSHTGQYLKTVL